jgi:hypothetical protein
MFGTKLEHQQIQQWTCNVQNGIKYFVNFERLHRRMKVFLYAKLVRHLEMRLLRGSLFFRMREFVEMQLYAL